MRLTKSDKIMKGARLCGRYDCMLCSYIIDKQMEIREREEREKRERDSRPK